MAFEKYSISNDMDGTEDDMQSAVDIVIRRPRTLMFGLLVFRHSNMFLFEVRTSCHYFLY